MFGTFRERSPLTSGCAMAGSVVALLLTISCDDKDPNNETRSANSRSATSENITPPLYKTKPSSESEVRGHVDPSLLPIKALQELEGLALRSEFPCSDTIESLGPTLDSIRSHRKKLANATTNLKASTLLAELANELHEGLPTIASRNETIELRGIGAELIASLSDLSASLKLASDALAAGDRVAAEKLGKRVDNGVSNTRSSIERLIGQCPL